MEAKQHPDDATPKDFLAALRDRPDALAAFESLPPSHRREYLAWIAQAKQPETRARRVSQAVEMILAKRAAH